MKKLTKANIEELAKKVINWAKGNKLGYDWCLFYNGKRYDPVGNKITENVNPLDYCEYFPEKFIMGMAYDGQMYELMNYYWGYSISAHLESILRDYGLYLEHCDSCHAVIAEEDEMDVEYTIFEAEKRYDLYGIGRCSERRTYEEAEYPRELDAVMAAWRAYSQKGHHDGSCIIGEGIEFKFKGNEYKMFSQCIYQGNIHFEECARMAADWLKKIGATDIWIDHGRLD